MKLPIALWICLITFENAFDQKIGPVYSPNGPMLEFEITGDRNNFVDLQKIYLEIRCKVTQSNGADLRYDNTDPTVSDSPFLVNNSLYSLFSDCTLSANGLKISNANSNFAHKSLIGTEFSNSKGAKDSWLKCQGYRFENNPGAIDAADFTSQRELVRESREIWFYGPAGVDFFTCDKHLLSGVTLRLSFRRSHPRNTSQDSRTSLSLWSKPELSVFEKWPLHCTSRRHPLPLVQP